MTPSQVPDRFQHPESRQQQRRWLFSKCEAETAIVAKQAAGLGRRSASVRPDAVLPVESTAARQLRPPEAGSA